MSNLKKVSISILAILSFLIAFISGYFLKNNYIKENDFNKRPPDLMPFFNDEIIFITKDKPHLVFIANATRYTEDNKTYKQREKVYFYDGVIWQKYSEDMYTDSTLIKPTSLVPKWDIKDDTSRVLKQSINGETVIDGVNIKFDIPVIENEMGIRSLSNYTIFRSEAKGNISINDKVYEGNILYTRTYSYNASIESISVSAPVGINTEWLAFWDETGNFYNVDETKIMDDIKGEYKSHSIAVTKDLDQKIQKSFDLNIKKKDMSSYEIDMANPINSRINFEIINSINKNPNNKVVKNIIGQIEGEIETKDGKKNRGFGIFEYIYQ